MFENRDPQPKMTSALPPKGEVARDFNARAHDDVQGANVSLARVLAERPDLASQPCVMPQSGQCALTYLFPNEVVKMPRTASQQDDFNREFRILAHLHRAGLPVPAVTSVGADGAFYAQQRLSGVQMNVDRLDAGTLRYELAIQEIAHFMIDAQQAVGAADAAALGLAAQTPDAAAMESLLAMPLYQSLLREADEDIAAALRDYVVTRAGAAPCFTHADINPSNILCDEKTGDIRAFVDFGLCHYGDPAVAFHALYRYFPHEFVDRVADIYAEETKTEPVRFQQAVTARLAYELSACAAGIAKTGELNHGHRRWLQDLMVEYDNSVSGYQPKNQHFFGFI